MRILPTQDQIENCERFGWEYHGDGYFTNGEQIGYFTERGFIKI